MEEGYSSFIKLQAEKIIDLLQKESVSIYSLPAAGQNTLFYYLDNYYELQGSNHFDFFIYLHTVNGLEQDELKKQIAVYLSSKLDRQVTPENLLFVLREELKKKKRFVFAINHFEEIKNNREVVTFLNSLREADIYNVRFLTGWDLSLFDKHIDFTEGLAINPFPIRYMKKGESKEVLDLLVERFGWTTSSKHIDQIIKLSGGIPGLLKYLLKFAYYNKDLDVAAIFENVELHNRLERLNIALNAGHERYFSGLNFTDEKGRLKSELLELFVKNPSTEQEKFEELTNQEYKLFNLFETAQENLVSLEAIAQELWGDNSNVKYSQWSIYKTISNLNKKLRKHKFEVKNIKTRGYKLISIN